MEHDHNSSIVVINGPAGCGKTTLCLRAVDAARKQGLVVHGVLSLPRLLDGNKLGIDVLDLSNSERRPLAESGLGASGPATESWRFHADALAWGIGILRRSIPSDLFVIDELGPLELLRGAGWVDAAGILRSGGYRWALVVVRPGLVERFLEMVPSPQATVVTVTADGQERLLAEITSLWGNDNAQD